MIALARPFLVLCVCALLSPVAAVAKDAPAQPQKAENVMKIIESHKELSKFASLIEESGLQGVFESKTDTYTVFAPSNEALSKMSGDDSKKIKEDKKKLESFVKYHVIKGSHVMFGSIHGRRAGLASMGGETLVFEGMSVPVKVNKSGFVAQDLEAMNGVVHVMDAALIPGSFAPIVDTRKEMEDRMPPEMKARMEDRKAEMEKKVQEMKTKGGSTGAESASPEPGPQGASSTSAPKDAKAQPKKEGQGWLGKLMGN